MGVSLFDKFRPQFYTYYNIARHNAYITLCHISELVGGKVNENMENRILEMRPVNILNKKGYADTKMFVMRQLYRRFPMLKVMAACGRLDDRSFTATPEMLYEVLENLFKVLNYERDRASHWVFVDPRTNDPEYIEKEKKVADYLNDCFTVAIRLVRARFELKAEQMEFLSKDRYRRKKAGGKQELELNTDFYYSIKDKDMRLSDMGRLFLISLFIEKRYASIFFDALQKNGKSYFYRQWPEKSPERHILREVFSAYRIRLPRERLDNERGDIALALDMLNELKKCPEELFGHLSKEDQERFRVSASTGDEVLLRRSSDRFPSLALQYIDDQKLFESIRFHVNIGKYRFLKKEDKRCIDGETRIRVLQHEMNAFGRIGELEKIRSSRDSKWKSSEKIQCHEDVSRDDVSILPYITDSRAQYLFNGDKIGLAWANYMDCKGEKCVGAVDKSYIPEVTADNKVSCVQPDCWMSKYEIPAMIFHLLLYGSETKETEKLIIKCVDSYKIFFKAIRDEKVQKVSCRNKKEPVPEEYHHIEVKYGLKWNDIPDKIRDYLVGRTRSSFNKYAAEILKKEQEKTERMKAHLENDKEKVSGKDNKMGKKSYVEIRPGRLAVFLIRDILYLQPTRLEGEEKGRDKLTGMNYNILQAEIALYDTRNNERDTAGKFKNLFKKSGIIDSDNPHPFLGKVFERQPKDTVEFYQYYLEERLEWLKNIKKENYESVSFLKRDRMKWNNRDKQYYKDLAKRYLAQPIELPRGLFEESIALKMIDLCGDSPERKGLKSDLVEYYQKENPSGRLRFNVAYLIKKYFEEMCDDKAQAFYNYARSYRIVDMLEGKKCYKFVNALEHYDFNTKKECYLSGLMVDVKGRNNRPTNKKREPTDEERKSEECKLKRLYHHYTENERLLRCYKTQDMLLFMMAKKIIGAKVENFKLKKIAPDKEQGILELQVPFELKVTLKNGTTIKIFQDKIKIKNYGDFYCFLYDERIKSLLPQIEVVEIDRAVLEEELSKYDHIRPHVFDLTLSFEKAINSKRPELAKEKHGFTDLLNSLTKYDEVSKEKIRLIRNAFSHNEYPKNIDKSYKLPDVAENLDKELEENIKKMTT